METTSGAGERQWGSFKNPFSSINGALYFAAISFKISLSGNEGVPHFENKSNRTGILSCKT